MKKILALILSLVCVVSMLPQMNAAAIGSSDVWSVTDETATAEETTSINVAAYKNGGSADADNVTVTGGDKGFLNDGSYGNMWVAANASTPVSGWVEFDARYKVDTVRVVFEEGETVNFTAYYYDSTTGAYKELYSGTSYNEANTTDVVGHKYYSEYVLETPVVTNKIKVTVTSTDGTVPAIAEIEAYGTEYDAAKEPKNLAFGQTATASFVDWGRAASNAVDGNLNSFWDGAAVGDGRYYLYYIETSMDGETWTKVADREETYGTVAAFEGESYTFDEIEAQYVRVTITKNSANGIAHMKELEIWGYPSVIRENIAFGRKVRTHLSTGSVVYVTDGLNITTCTGEFAPAYFDIDLEQNYDLREVILNFPAKSEGYYYYTIYGSLDGSNYDRLFQQRSQEAETDGVQTINLKELGLETTEYRIVRVYMEYASGSSAAILSEVRIHGTATGENTGDLRTGTIDEILGIKHFNETEYAKEITESETIENVYGIIERNIGAAYRDWFTFKLAENTESDNDYFEVSYDAVSGKVLVIGNDGVSLASGLNYYLEEYCNVQIAEQTSQVVMPESMVKPEVATRCETPYKIRYAFNYCTLNYTFSYADAEVFQKEYDWMALNGVNCVIDLAGQEAVWIKFLQNFGYTFDEARDWIAGPTYYAWQFMQNMEVVGGPVSDEWIVGRLEMARENQRFKISLGMQTVLQGYAGMVPCNFADFQDVEILDQGTWCALPRPDMIRTDGELYDQYAELFYAAQEWAFGATSDYYAVDPFHEGGIRPDDLSDEVIAEEVLDSLLKYDEDAVWMVQAWWSNPSNELLNGMGEYRQDHVIILDLTGVYGPKWSTTTYGSTTLDAIEFNGTDWVCCLLDNYGGNPSMDGNLQKVIDSITNARDTAQHMKGIGLISEATYDNPALYQLLFDMTWVETETMDIDEWMDDYVVDRYGVESENAREAWDILESTVYGRDGHTTQVMASTGPSLKAYGLPYSSVKLEKALKLLYEDFDILCESESYMYDLTEIMRQVVNNYAVVKLGELKEAYDAGDITTFKTLKESFLNAFDIIEEVCGTQVDLMAGEWIGKAEDWAIDTGADDFAYDSMVINAKTIITVWAPSSYLGSYAYRNYQGMFDDIYKPLWQNFLDRQEDILETGSTSLSSLGYTALCMEWIYGDQDYSREADNSKENMAYVVELVINECSTEVFVPENVGNIALEKPVTTTSERADSPGAPGGGYAAHITDGYADTYWDGVRWDINPEAVIDLEDAYIIDKMNVLCYVEGTRYYLYDIYTSLDGENWTLLVNKTATDAGTDDGDTFTFEEEVVAKYIKIVGTYNSSNEGFHVKEVRAYGELYPEVNKEALENALEKVPSDLSVYTDETAAALNEAVEAAQAVKDNVLATEEEVASAAKAVEDAVAGLELKAADYSAVEAAKAKVPADLSAYTPSTAAKVNEAVEAVVVGLDITKQAEVDAMAKAIEDAVAGLVEKADKTDLEAAFEAVEELKKEDYTEESWKSYEEALKAAEDVFADEEATQEEVDAAIEALAGAIAGLEEKPAEVPDKDTDTDKEDSDKEESPVTGDNSMMMLYVIMMFAAVLVFVKKRRA